MRSGDRTERTEFITSSGPFDQPISHFRVAMLTVAIALSVIICLFLLTVPRATHGIKVDLPFDMPFAPNSRPIHQLDIGANGALIFDGARVNGVSELRRILDLQQNQDPAARLLIEPDPELTYGDFMRILAVVKRAGIYPDCIRFEPIGHTSIEHRREVCRELPILVD